MSQVPDDDAQSSTRASQDRPDVDLASIPSFSPTRVPSTPTIVAQEQAPAQLSISSGQEPARPTPPLPRHKGKDTTIIAAILTILLTFSGTFLGTTAYNNHQNTIIANAIATARIYASATAIIAHATATSQAKTLTNYPFSNDLVLDDPLSNSSKATQYGWDQGNGCAFTNGAYEATVSKSNFFLPCASETTHFANFTFEVQMSIKKGGNNAEGGIIFRANANNSRYYILFVSGTGYYELDIYTSANGTNAHILQTGTFSSFITGSSQAHTISVVANGSQISIYIDQTRNPVFSVFDTTYNSGQIGVVSSYGSSTTVVDYNNAKVWQLP